LDLEDEYLKTVVVDLTEEIDESVFLNSDYWNEDLCKVLFD
jgi:hypothetical protein